MKNYRLHTKERFLRNYGISEQAFLLTQEFFDEFKVDFYLELKFVRILLVETLKRRKDVNLSEAHINQVLKLIDADNDDKINQKEFFQLLIMLFSTADNIHQRIKGMCLGICYRIFKSL